MNYRDVIEKMAMDGYKKEEPSKMIIPVGAATGAIPASLYALSEMGHAIDGEGILNNQRMNETLRNMGATADDLIGMKQYNKGRVQIFALSPFGKRALKNSGIAMGVGTGIGAGVAATKYLKDKRDYNEYNELMSKLK